MVLKKRYNDTYKSSKNLISGSEWYCHQAFRALNQAAGMSLVATWWRLLTIQSGLISAIGSVHSQVNQFGLIYLSSFQNHPVRDLMQSWMNIRKSVRCNPCQDSEHTLI